jgi:hypothetical protein
MAKIALVDNVLLQQAVSTTRGLYRQNDMEIRLPIARILPQDYAGVTSDDEFAQTVAVPEAFRYVIVNLLQTETPEHGGGAYNRISAELTYDCNAVGMYITSY